MRLMWIKAVLLIAAGLCAGAMVAAGFFAFITAIGVVTTYAWRTKTAGYIKTYENTLAGSNIGIGSAGNVLLIVAGLCYGIFVGSLIVALAETIKTVPVFFRRAKITMGLPAIIIAFALGKGIGNILFYLFGMKVC